MGETVDTVGRWADETFGPVSNRATVAARANREMAELIQALVDNDLDPSVGEETADVVICLMRLAFVSGFDLDVEIDRKMAINRERRWIVSPNGHGQHVNEPDPSLARKEP